MSGADTIFALSSGRPPAGIAIIRVSGPRARSALETLVGMAGEERRTRLATLRDPQTGEAIDRCVTVLFAAPASATGEDVAEFHLHGGRAVVADTLAVLSRLPGLRPAEAGEFTRRAFVNGVMDLASVEGLADLIAAETTEQRRQALRQANGALGAIVGEWRRQLVDTLALVEASIDFADEGDIPTEFVGPARQRIATLESEIMKALSGAEKGERLRDGMTVVIAGRPNAGKSSLLNALARRDVAIVSPLPGTTRDAIEVHLDLAGLPVTVIDTAGIRADAEGIEQHGILRARDRIAAADLVLWLSAGGRRDDDVAPAPCPIWHVGSKCDLGDSVPVGSWHRRRISVVTGEGLDELVADLTSEARAQMAGGEIAVVTRSRHVAALTESLKGLRTAASFNDSEPELMAESLRQAARALGRVVGDVDVEDVLGSIFSTFCIGK